MEMTEQMREWSASDVGVLQGRDLRWEVLWDEAQRLGRDPALEPLENDELEQQLCTQAVALAAATCRFLELLAEFVVRGVWAEQGARTPAVWLSWRLGIAPGTAREQVRVALRLRELPAIRARFAAGRLSYSKVRALTRIALSELEEMLLEWADAATAAELEKIAQSLRWAQKGRFDDEVARRQRRSIRQRRHGDGTVSITIRCDEDEAAELLARLDRRVQSGRRHDWEDTAAAGGGEVSAEASGTDNPGEPGGVCAEASGPDRPESPDNPGEPGEPGGVSAETDAGGLPGNAPDSVSAETEEKEGLCLFVPSDSAELVDELLGLVASADPDGLTDTSGLDRHTLVLHAPLDALTGQDGQPGGPVPVQDHHGRIGAMDRRVLRRLACEAGIVVAVTDHNGTPIDIGRRDRRLSVALRRALLLRDRSCRFPGCGVTRNLHGHHIWHWGDGGPTDLANLVVVCAAHHTYIHDHDLWVELRPDGRHQFLRPDGTPVPRVDRHTVHLHPPAPLNPPPDTLDPDALTPPHWWPGQADYNMAVGVLQQQLAALDPPALAA